jgi:hypothetical protein
MVKFLGLTKQNPKPVYGVGLTPADFQKLLAGQPVFLDLDVMAFDGGETDVPEQRGCMIVFAGQDNLDLQRIMQENGAIDGTTEVRPMKPLGE